MIDPKLIDPFQNTLFSGKYNLLLGSGVSLSSRNQQGENLRGTEELRLDICRLTDEKDTTSISRAYDLLSPQQIRSELIDKYSHCQPARELLPMRRFLWKRIFTFNIDDVIENIYRDGDRAQKLRALNFDSLFEPDTDKSELQCIHLHGFTRQPENGFVFSHNEYARRLQDNNAWMLLLSEVLPSESFIIAGTSFNEIDLEYYLSRRTSSTPRRGRGPSFLIDPNPGPAARADCKKYNLILIEAGFEQFLAWLEKSFPNPPSASGLIVPRIENIFRSEIDKATLLRFFSDFELVRPQAKVQDAMPRAYMYGAEPTWSDVNEHLDVERAANEIAMKWLTKWLERPSSQKRVLLISDEPATGKSTLLKRVGCDLASLGRIVFYVQTVAKIDTKTAARCLRQRTSSSVILVDNFADCAEQIRDLLEEIGASAEVVVVGAERGYRKEHVDVIIPDASIVVKKLGNPTAGELNQLIEKYKASGLIADKSFIKNSQHAVDTLSGDPIAIAVCRILNDYRPFDKIVDSIWEAASETQRKIYLACALARRCFATGVRRSILQMIAGTNFSVDSLLEENCPLPLAVNSRDDDFLLPRSVIVAERGVLDRIAKRERERNLTISVFTDLAKSIAPRVNRKGIRKRTPETRLAGRLFDADKIVRPFLAEHSEDFYVAVKDAWEWNSRYWEQRALLVVDRDIKTALQYARHAVAIEEHPFPLTTLGTVLLKYLDSCMETDRDPIFAEAFVKLSLAISMEENNARVSVRPFSVLLNGTSRFLESGGSLTPKQRDEIRSYAYDARYRYGEDLGIAAAIRKLDSFMQFQ